MPKVRLSETPVAVLLLKNAMFTLTADGISNTLFYETELQKLNGALGGK
jgi:hypothetical protein